MIQTLDPIVFRFKAGKIEVALYNRPKDTDRYPSVSSLPGGMIFEDKDHNLEDSLNRILNRKMPLPLSFMDVMPPVGNNSRDPDGWSMTIPYLCITNSTENYTQGHWVPIESLVLTPNKNGVRLPFDHNELIESAWNILKNRASYSTLPVFFMPEKFTLIELQKCCETISGNSIHKASFRKRWLNSGVITPLNEQGYSTCLYSGESKRERIANLYTINTCSPMVFFERTMTGTKK